MPATIEISQTRVVLMGIFIGAAYVVWGLLFSIQPPFYPTEAEKKGATPSQYGFVFGITHLAAFLFAPIFARYGTRIGPKLLYNMGGFLQGFTAIAFGFLVYVNDTATFLGLSYFLRFLDGTADAASWVAVLGILIEIWPDKVASIVSWTEMFYGLGYTIGPAIGSYLYIAGGFKLPFITVGTFGVFISIGLIFVLPNLKTAKRVIPSDSSSYKMDSDAPKRKLTLKDIFSCQEIFMPYVDNTVNFFGYGFIEAMLAPHLKDAGATQLEVGNTFLVMGAFYMVLTPLSGYVCDEVKHPILVSIDGNFFMCVAMFFIGPAPFLRLEPSVRLIMGMSALIGFAYSQIMVSTFARVHSAAMRHGYEDGIATYLLISGMWSATFYFGNFLGPTLAGVLVDAMGFRNTTMVFFSSYLVMLIVDCVTFCLDTRKIPVGDGYVALKT